MTRWFFPGGTRRLRLAAGALCGALAWSAQGVQAQDYPARAIRIVVPFAAGGTSDMLARLVARGLGTGLGQAVLVENKAGAGGNLAAAEVARSAANGYTLLLATPGPLAINQYAYANPGYGAQKQFVAVSGIAMVPNVLLASSQSGLKTVADVLATARAAPGKLNYASAGMGSTSHLAGELFKSSGKVAITHIPYRGMAPAMNDLVAGQIELLIDNLPTAMPMIDAGKVVALGVTAKNPVAALPGVPPIAAVLPGYELQSWFGLVAPAGTPAAAIAKLAGALDDFLKQDETRAGIAKMGTIPDGGSPERFAALIQAEQARFRALVKRANIHVE